jgi:hypothetical protein
VFSATVNEKNIFGLTEKVILIKIKKWFTFFIRTPVENCRQFFDFILKSTNLVEMSPRLARTSLGHRRDPSELAGTQTETRRNKLSFNLIEFQTNPLRISLVGC